MCLNHAFKSLCVEDSYALKSMRRRQTCVGVTPRRRQNGLDATKIVLYDGNVCVKNRRR